VWDEIRATGCAIYMGFRENLRWQKSYHFPSLNQTLSHNDSRVVKKGRFPSPRNRAEL
jgi:hypothetical protein